MTIIDNLNNFNSYLGGSFDTSELLYDACGNINGNGYNVNSILLKAGINPTVTFNQNGGLLFNTNNLVIPSWLLSYPNYKISDTNNYNNNDNICNISNIIKNKENLNKNQYEENDEIEDDLYNKLLDLVKINPDEINKLTNSKRKSKKTQKFRIKSTKSASKTPNTFNKTRRN